MSMVLVAGLVLVALDTFGSVATAESHSGDQGRAQLLALSLMSEVMSSSYADPLSAGDYFGPEPSEVGIRRALFNDVDDYFGWLEATLTDCDGVALDDIPSGWSRSVSVQYSQPANLNQKSFTDQGIKRVTIKVFHHGIKRAELTAIRTGKPMGPSVFSLIEPILPDAEIQ